MKKIAQLQSHAHEIREHTIRCIRSVGMGHIGGCLSIADVLAALYFDVMRVDANNPGARDRDRLVMSKGHAGPALYAALALKGFFPLENLLTLNAPGTLLPSHCDRKRTPGIDATTGSLGQGLSIALGIALGARLDKLPSRTYCILGEGDLQEGQTWEAVMLAGNRKLGHLVAVLDINGWQIDGAVNGVNSLGDLKSKFESFGWSAIEVADGNNMAQLVDALSLIDYEGGKPTALVLHTVKGKGVPFMENRVEFHHAALPAEKWQEALETLQ